MESTLRSSEKRGRIKCPSQPSPLVSQHRFKAPSVYSQFQLYGKRVDAPRSLKFLVSSHSDNIIYREQSTLNPCWTPGPRGLLQGGNFVSNSTAVPVASARVFPCLFFWAFGFSKWDQENEFIGTKMSCFVTNKAREWVRSCIFSYVREEKWALKTIDNGSRYKPYTGSIILRLQLE